MEVPEVRTGQDAKAGMTFPISGDACDIVWCYRMRKISTLFIVASAAFAQFPRAESAADRNPFAGQPEAVAAGRKLFATSCSACHGANGEGGRGPNLTMGRAIRRLNERGTSSGVNRRP